MNTELETEINRLSSDNQEKLYNFLQKELRPDTIDISIRDLKLKCYSLYYNEITELINEIEVYNHTLPNQLYGFIEYIFNLLSFSTLPDVNNKDMLELVVEYEQLLIQVLYIILINNLLNNIKDYKKTFSKFNSRGVYFSNNKENIMDWSNYQYKVLLKKYKNCIETFRKTYNLNNSLFLALCNVKEYSKKINTKVGFLDLEDSLLKLNEKNDYSEMSKLLEEVKYVNDECEKYYPDIVGNGYTKDIWNVVFDILSIVSVISGLIFMLI